MPLPCRQCGNTVPLQSIRPGFCSRACEDAYYDEQADLAAYRDRLDYLEANGGLPDFTVDNCDFDLDLLYGDQ